MAAVVWECSNHSWKVLVPNISGCPGGSDCGLFVLAFAYTLCAGAVPEKMTYNQSELTYVTLFMLFDKEELLQNHY